jgi:hypothetical protein
MTHLFCLLSNNRLTAPFAIVVLVSATLVKYIGSGPMWPFVDQNVQQTCANNWWSALLYVQNYVNVTSMVNMKNSKKF